MTTKDSMNRPLELALRFILHTNRSVFLTGKAGTGKTSFLKTVREQCGKKMAVVAPTGVAAINAGGVTMHTFFQLPLGSYVPSGTIPDAGEQLFNNKASLLRNLRFSHPKKELFQELELLVIDEVSMVRADLLDAMDAVLRYIRKRPLQPFGGVQVLFIGDLLQLPPVVGEKEWIHLKEFYNSPFFFDAQVMKEAAPFIIELKKIYRQTDERFINLLNDVRNNQLDQIDWHELHERFNPGFQSTTEDHYITLSTHNNRADTINQQELNRLNGGIFRYEAEITGDFGEKAYPAEAMLELKQGAQIMFIKNDKGEFRRYYNGKIGVVDSLDEETIAVSFPGEDTSLILEKETWKNIRYKLDKVKDKIEEEELGTFSQYPIRLAWAITIHKSQGLTFEKAIVDAGSAFAPGQVYVALSRLTSLNGLVLKTRIPLAAIQTDQRVVAYTAAELAEAELETALKDSEQEYVVNYFIQCFQMEGMETLAADWLQEIEKKTTVAKVEMVEAYQLFQRKIIAIQQVANKTSQHFATQMAKLNEVGPAYVYQRTQDALNYFSQLMADVRKHLEEHREAMKKEARLTKYQRVLAELNEAIAVRQQRMEKTLPIAAAIKDGLAGSQISELIQELNKPKTSEQLTAEEGQTGKGIAKPAAKVEKQPKMEVGASLMESISLCKEGQSIQEIAAVRSLANSTIEGHLVRGIRQGDLEPDFLVSATVRELVARGVTSLGSPQLGPLKELLGDGISYTEIKAALAHMQFKGTITTA